MTRKNLPIVVVGSDATKCSRIAEKLRSRGHAAVEHPGGRETLATIDEHGVLMCLLALPLSDMGGAELIAAIRRLDTNIPIVVGGRDPSIGSAADALECGVHDYIEEFEEDPVRLLSAVGVAVGARATDVHLRYLRGKDAAGAGWEALVAESDVMKSLVERVRQICRHAGKERTPAILLTGETGTGKGLLARCIHYNSVRRTQPFVDINCAAIPASLMEAQLFGHERGAFTGATTPAAGLFRTADKGTLFLDEIGSLPLDLQAKLLTAIEDKRIRPVGGTHSVHVDVQVIAATHGDLQEAVSRREFREDLYYRLNVLGVHLPPLRSRGEDRVLLAESFVASMCRDYGLRPRRLTPDALHLIRTYPWPGNVRELRNQIERVILLHEREEISAADFQLGVGGAQVAIGGSGEALHVTLPSQPFSLEGLEREVIRLTLEKFPGNLSQAARFLQVSRQTLLYRVKKFGLRED